jgi:Ca-activated chloride channel family protein
MTDYHFQNPCWLLALAALVLVGIARRWRHATVFVVPHAAEWQPTPPAPRAPWPALAAYVGLALLAVALARPQWIEHQQPDKKPGYDIILALDLSTSMYAEDFQDGGRTLNRLQTVKPIIEAFINRRPNDRIGIVVFAGRAYTFAPLTFDHEWLRKQTARLAIGAVEDGTAIGDALGVALSRLDQGARNKEAHRIGAFAVILTDGASNRGLLDPRQTAELAAEKGVVVHTIGAGVEGMVPMPVFDHTGKRTGTELRPSDLDGLLLRDIAEKTGGLFFRASDAKAITNAFAEIDRTERVEFTSAPLLVTRELFSWFLLPALPFLLLAVVGASTQSRREVFA